MLSSPTSLVSEDMVEFVIVKQRPASMEYFIHALDCGFSSLNISLENLLSVES